jgi:tetratricopeptide (TPR) repeat protein
MKQLIRVMAYMLPVFMILPVGLWPVQDMGAQQLPVIYDSSDQAGEPYSGDDDFRHANQLYTQGEFEDAVAIYRRIIDSGVHSAELYYNLGNAYYRLGAIPSAILNYERAALLAPGDEDIKFNLEIAGSRVRDRIGELPVFFLNRWWTLTRGMLSAPAWALLSAVTFSLTLILISLFLFSSSVVLKKVCFWSSVLVLMVSLLSFSLGLDQRNYSRNHNTAIVFSPVVPVKSSPDKNSTDLFVIHEGTKVRVEDSIGDWRSVRLNDGNKGWVHKDVIEMI